jgi:hypothetical protein
MLTIKILIIIHQIESLTGARHTKGGKLEYEVAFVGKREKDNRFISREDLEKMSFGPLCKQVGSS